MEYPREIPGTNYLSGVHDEGALLHILSDSEERKEPDPALHGFSAVMEGHGHCAGGHGHTDRAPVVLVSVLDHVVDRGVDDLHAPGTGHLYT